MIYQNVRKVIRSHQLCDWIFCNRYSASPYRACSHGCRYCDGRAEKYYVDGDFEKSIVVRKNFLDLLPTELNRIREKGLLSFGSGVTDVYQPIEASEQIIRKAAGILLHYHLPVLIVTKSALVLRDLDLWREKNEQDGFVLMISLASLREDIRKNFEAGASTVGERLETIRQFKQAGCTVGVLSMPMLPYISDSYDDFKNLCQTVRECGADFVIPGNLTLRPGRQKDCYLETVKKSFPDVFNKTREIYKEQRQSGNTIKSYRDDFYNNHMTVLDEIRIPGFLPHAHFRKITNICDETFILLQHLSYLYKSSNKAQKRLKLATKKFADFLIEERMVFNRKRSLHPGYMDDFLVESTQNGKLKDLIRNDKLYYFMKKSIIERKIFDYIDKHWI